MSPPLVSIVTPSYNQGRFLRRTIESVLNQTYPHVEYIVIDGGSTDDSVKILESYGDRFHWVSERDEGQSDAINKGFGRSHGEIRAYLNSDDVLVPTAVERVVTFFSEHSECQLAYGRAHHIDEEDRLLGSYRTAPYSLQRLAEESCICQPAAFWRRSLAERIGEFDPNLNYCMDYDYWLRAAVSGEHIRYVEEVLACSRWYAETKTSSGRTPMYLESIAVFHKHLGSAPQGPFLGLWRHRGQTAHRKWLKWLAKMPGLVSCFAKVHRRWWLHRQRAGRLFNPY